MIKALMFEYPFLDQMMAETLVRAYENGTLPSENDNENEDAQPLPALPPVVLKNITVTNDPIEIQKQIKNVELP